MICKPKLLLHPDKWSNAVVPYLEHLFDEYFERDENGNVIKRKPWKN